MIRWHKPRWLYELLPYLYIGGGAATLLGVRNLGAVLSSLLLVSAGGVIWKMRRDYRQRHHGETDAGTLGGAEGASPLVQMIWRSSFEVGHEGIDRQHRRLFVLGNELVNAILLRKSKGDVELMLDDLVNNVAEHFEYEEEVMRGVGRALPADHLAAHRKMLAETKRLRECFHRGELQVAEVVGYVAYDVIVQHIIKDDRDCVPAT